MALESIEEKMKRRAAAAKKSGGPVAMPTGRGIAQINTPKPVDLPEQEPIQAPRAGAADLTIVNGIAFPPKPTKQFPTRITTACRDFIHAQLGFNTIVSTLAGEVLETAIIRQFDESWAKRIHEESEYLKFFAADPGLSVVVAEAQGKRKSSTPSYASIKVRCSEELFESFRLFCKVLHVEQSAVLEYLIRTRCQDSPKA